MSPPIAGFVRDIEARPPRGAVSQEAYLSTDMPRARVVQEGEPVVGSVAPSVSGERAGEPPQAMAGKRRVGDEHEVNVRPSTEEKHQIGQTRKARQEAAADLRNAAAREGALLSRMRQLASKFERMIKNVSPGERKYLSTEEIDAQTRYQSLLQELSSADLEEIDKLRTQLRRELGIRGSELDDYIIDELDRLNLLPSPPEE